jgi:hypothetical protein
VFTVLNVNFTINFVEQTTANSHHDGVSKSQQSYLPNPVLSQYLHDPAIHDNESIINGDSNADYFTGLMYLAGMLSVADADISLIHNIIGLSLATLDI